MKIILLVLLVITGVLCQDFTSSHQQQYFAKQPTLEPAPARPEPIKRAGYSISHGDAKSSVQVNLHPVFQQPESIQLGAEDVQYSSPQQDYYQGQEGLVQYQAPKQSYLTDLANKQYLNINPNNVKPDIISQGQPQQQLYNVGYSINIDSNTNPKLSYRVPMPKNPHSYRQQKLLNAEVITGTNKALVEKPIDFTQANYEFASSNVQPSANYISSDQGKGQYAPNFAEKQSLTKVYADVKNTHGYTWKTLSPNVEISGYHSLNDMSQHQQNFDHAAALGRSQGFDISNVVENGKTQYQPNVESQAYNINKGLSDVSSSKTQVSNIETSDNHGFGTSGTNTGSNEYDTSSVVDLKFDTPTQNSYPSYGGFSTQFKSGDLSFNSSPFKHNLLSTGSNIEFDKSLLDGFYKNYNPLFYQPEVTLPSPNLPKNININLHGAASHQYPTYNLKYSAPPAHFKNSISLPQSNPHMQMINQHYAFVQASEADNQHGQGQSLPPVSDDVKPVTEQQEDSHGQQSQQQVQQVVVQSPSNQNNPNPNPKPNFKDQKGKGNTEHKKYVPQGSPASVPVRQYGRPVVYVNDKNNYRMKNLRPPPMIIIHKNY